MATTKLVVLQVLVASFLYSYAVAAPAAQASEDTEDGGIPRHRVVREAWTNTRIANRLSNMGARDLPRWLSVPRPSAGPSGHTAITFGRGHVITFDGKFYQFPGSDHSECIHVLARDRVSHSFTIMRDRSTISLITQHTAITLHSNNKVEINNTGEYSDLPVQSWDHSLTVTHDNTAVVIETRSGITIQCDLHHTLCLYRLSDNHHNNSLGLLGTNDGRPENDMVTRTGRVTENVQQFANSYELSSVSYCRQGAAPTQQCPNQHQATRCRHMFQSRTSPMNVCFGTVNAQPFLEACEYDASSCASDKARGLCDAVTAYSQVCRARSIIIATPGECGECHNRLVGSSWTEHVNKKLDIVFVTSLQTNTLPGDVELSLVLQRLSGAIAELPRKQTGIRHNIRLGIMGFDGSDFLQSPHVYTIQGEPFTREFSNAIWRRRVQSVEGYSQQTTSDPTLALSHVINYPFRHDAAKIVFLVINSPPSGSQAEALESLQSEFSSRGVVLNVVSAYPQLSSPGVVGIRGTDSTVIPGSHSTTPTRTVTFPTDLASQLTQSTGGSLFDLAKVTQGRHNVLHAIQDAVLAQLVQQASRCRQCRCMVGAHGHGVTSCTTHQCR